MAVPSPRNSIRPARGLYADLSNATSLAALKEGEIVFATDEDRLYVKENGVLTPVSDPAALKPGDNVSELTNDAGYITVSEVPDVDVPVTSVAGKTGDVTLDKSDVGLSEVDNTSDADKPVSVATQTELTLKADLVNGTVPNSQLPSIAVSEYLGEVATESTMLDLVGEKGDWCIRTDTSTTWVVTGDDSSLISSWVELATPADLVNSVNGYQGTVVLGPDDVGAIPATEHYWQRNGGVLSPSETGDSLDIDGSITVNYPGNAGSDQLLRMGNTNNSGNKSAHLFTAGGYYVVPNDVDGSGAAVSILDSGAITAAGKITAASFDIESLPELPE